VKVTGLPERIPLKDTHAEQPQTPIPGSILYAPDAQREFTIRYAAGGAG
jgi:hypothetical protein